jgi:dipeptidyl aminopeptidase/acylaminoacyl peptidase
LAIDPRTKERAVLVETNPQFATLRLGQVQQIDWTIAGDRHVSGGMYLPPDYVPGARYPLIIQTHGFREQTFVVDGPHMTASAAQPLANKGFIVLQLQDIVPEWVETSSELEHAMKEYDDAIDYLDQKEMIDPKRVGIVGFSRTCMYVKYALTHSTHHFAAAVVSDGVDAGYMQYLLFLNADPLEAADSDTVIGAAPFGKGLTRWLEKSPGFGLDRVQTPLQIQALGTDSVLTEWEWFAGLRRLQKPVDLVYLPTASHVLVKPWDRIVSQQGIVDWFSFWLENEEDTDPQKTKQYALWRELRTQTVQ